MSIKQSFRHAVPFPIITNEKAAPKGQPSDCQKSLAEFAA